MQHVMSSRAIVGEMVLEVKGESVRIKRRGSPDLFVPLAAAAQVAEFLLLAARPAR